MRVVCPHCQAAYQLEQTAEDAILVCHRCGTEFSHSQLPGGTGAMVEPRPDRIEEDSIAPPEAEAGAAEEAPPEDYPEAASDAVAEDGLIDETETEIETAEVGFEEILVETDMATHGPVRIIPADVAQATHEAPRTQEIAEENDTTLPPPPHKKVRIMPWLFAVILFIAAAGFGFKYEAWLDDPWLRSVLINVGAPLEIRDKDWRILPGSVQAQWVKRSDGSQVLVVKGRVKNLLRCEIPLPTIRFSIFARNDPAHLLIEREFLISQPPLSEAIRRAPYLPPPEDQVPVTAMGDRDFVLVLQHLPEKSGDFTLAPVARGNG